MKSEDTETLTLGPCKSFWRRNCRSRRPALYPHSASAADDVHAR